MKTDNPISFSSREERSLEMAFQDLLNRLSVIALESNYNPSDIEYVRSLIIEVYQEKKAEMFLAYKMGCLNSVFIGALSKAFIPHENIHQVHVKHAKRFFAHESY